MAGYKSFTLFPLFFCLTFLVVGILTIWYSCSTHPNWKTSSFRNLHFCSTMNPFCVPHPDWSGSQCFPASSLLHTAYQPFQKGQLLSHVAVGSMFLSKNIAGWFSKLIWVISGIVFTATFFSWETGGADQSSESLQRRILPDRWPWQFVFDMTRFIYQHKFQLETESKGAEHGLILMNHHTELDWIYSWMVGIRFWIELSAWVLL